MKTARPPSPLLRLAVALCALGLAIAAHSEEAPPDKARADALAALIARLDDDDFTKREEAQEKLIAAGEPARAAVEQALKRKNLTMEHCAQLQTTQARLESALLWECITAVPPLTSFEPGKGSIEDTLRAYNKTYGMAVSMLLRMEDPKSELKPFYGNWIQASAQIGRWSNTRYSYGSPSAREAFVLYPVDIDLIPHTWHGPVFATDSGVLFQGTCKHYWYARTDIAGKKIEYDDVLLSVDVLVRTRNAHNFAGKFSGLVAVDASGKEHSLPQDQTDVLYDSYEWTTTLPAETRAALGGNPFDVKGAVVWQWPLEIRRHTFDHQIENASATVAEGRKLEVSVHEKQPHEEFVTITTEETIEVPGRGKISPYGWLIPLDKEGRRMDLVSFTVEDPVSQFILPPGGQAVPDLGKTVTTRMMAWKLHAKPAAMVYFFPAGNVERKLPFLLKGLMVPDKPKPKEPEKP